MTRLSKASLEIEGEFQTSSDCFWRLKKFRFFPDYYTVELRRYRKHFGSKLISEGTFCSLNGTLGQACKKLIVKHKEHLEALSNSPVPGDYK